MNPIQSYFQVAPVLTRFLLLVALAALVPSAQGQVVIDGISIRPSGEVEIRFPLVPDSYYILRSGSTATNISSATALRLGGAGVGELLDPGSDHSRTNRFYQIQQVPLSSELDLDGDGISDAVELSFGNLLNGLDPADGAADPDGDGMSTADELRLGRNPFVKDVGLTTFTSSPAQSEAGVSVNRETVLRFSRPLAADTTLSQANFRAASVGRSLLTRVNLSSDRLTATLFYLEPLPGATRVRVSFDASNVRDDSGQLVDADGDGIPGGTGVVEFDTFGNLPVPNTAVIGRVFASELGTNELGGPINRALAGVIVTVDGAEETLRALTDTEGRFTLSPAPSGRIFVHIDGRPAVGSTWPGGPYYPVVGKAWEVVAGKTNNLAGGTGEIFLPLIAADTLQRVSSTQDTTIGFPAQTLQEHPELAGVQLTVPPNALFADSGSHGGRMGIAPVPADRLPGPLPEGIRLPLVITVQTDGPLNLDRPAPVQFPNLPDPDTGITLPPGAKTALISFNHDTGDWEIAGSMTISADGRFAMSDPGSGIRQPGWHGTSPLCGGSGGGAGGGPSGGGPDKGGPDDLGTGPAPTTPGDDDGDFGGEGQPTADDKGPGDDGPSGPDGGGGPPPPCSVAKTMQKKNALTGFFDAVPEGELFYPLLGRQIFTIRVADDESTSTGIIIRGYEIFETLVDKPNSQKVFKFSFPLNISTNVIRKTVTLMQTHKSEDPDIPPSVCKEDLFFDVPPNAGAHWVQHFQGSNLTSGLTNNTTTFPENPNFRSNVERFLGELRLQNVSYDISSTFRTQKRAYLMHHCTKVMKSASKSSTPFENPTPYDPDREGVIDNCDGAPGCVGLLPINWIFLDRAGVLDRRATAAAGAAMASPHGGYNIAFAAGFPARRHGVRLAIDVTITSWMGTKTFNTGRPVRLPDGTLSNTMTITAQECPRYDEHGNIIGYAEFCNEDLWTLGASFGVIKLKEDKPHWSVDGH